MKIALFEWGDCALHGQETKWEGDIKDLGLITLITVGLVVKEDDNEITLCMDYSPKEKSWRSIATYPKCCIKKIKYLRYRLK